MQNEKGQIAFRRLDLSGLGAADLDSDFLNKIGLTRFSPAVIGQVLTGKAGERAGLRAGDEVLAVDAKPITSWEELVAAVQPSAGEPTRAHDPAGQRNAGSTGRTPMASKRADAAVGRIGVARDVALLEKQLVQVRYGPVAALGQAVVKTWDISVLSLQMLGKMIIGQVSLKNLSGPITIADYAGPVGADGLAALPALHRADQHQPGRAQPAAGAGTGWRPLDVLYC